MFGAIAISASCSRKNRDPHCHMAVIVVIVGDHCEHLFLHEKCRLSVRELFHSAGQRQAQVSDASNMIFVRHLPIKTDCQPSHTG